MQDHIIFLNIAKAEIETLIQYDGYLEKESTDGSVTRQDNEIVGEIMSDEFNHALLALLTAAELMGIQIATDGLSDIPEVEEDQNEDQHS